MQYATVGIVLSILKYLVELVVIASLTDLFYSPLDFVSPLLASKVKFLSLAPDWLGWAWLFWSLPFLWIGVCMSVRRAYDASISPWFGMIILVPFINIVGMITLALLPSKMPALSLAEEDNSEDRSEIDQAAALVVDAYRIPTVDLSTEPIRTETSVKFFAAFVGIASGGIYLFVTVLASTYLLGSYGAAMFFGAPIVTCAVSSYLLNFTSGVGIGKTLLHAVATLIIASLAFLLLGVEGGICIVMAIPLFIPLGILGAIVGYSIAVSFQRPHHDERKGLYGCIVLLPMIAVIESRFDISPTIEVCSSVTINAPIETVWQRVIDFPEITARPTGMLAVGIAYPIRAHMEGRGVGAVRHCEFTTGSFVEPITAWEEPVRLAFDVASQPEPMTELSPYRHLHPPHLDHTFRSTRGEFRLAKLPDGTTRLEGSTWYQIDMGPRLYWKIWTDEILHRIHLRVLEHVKESAEND